MKNIKGEWIQLETFAKRLNMYNRLLKAYLSRVAFKKFKDGNKYLYCDESLSLLKELMKPKNREARVYNCTWTPQAISCYKRYFNCTNCEVYKTIEGKCRMKKAIMDLIRKNGVPKEAQRYTDIKEW